MIIEALQTNTTVRVVYLHNPIVSKDVALQLEDSTVDALIATLKQGRIWGANIGEWGAKITSEAWQRLADAIPDTMLGCMYISEPDICGLRDNQKKQMIDSMRFSRNEKWTDDTKDS